MGATAKTTLRAVVPFAFPGVTAIDGVHTSDLHSFELGISRPLFDDVRFTTRFRYLPSGAGLNARKSRTDNLNLVAGYQVMCVTSGAVASDNSLNSNFIFGTGMDGLDSVLYHGATVGFKYRR